MKKPNRWFGQWNPSVDHILYENFFKDQENGGILVECGCANGLEEVNGKIFEEDGWLCINIEPFPNHYLKLVENRPFHLGNINLDCVLSDKDNEIIEFDVGPIKGNIKQGKSLSWKTMISKIESVIESIDLFILDVEGSELKVIDGMKGSNILPEIICAEYTWVGLENLDYKLKDLGYNRLFLSYNNSFYCKKDQFLKYKKDKYFGETEHWSKLGINC